MIKVKKDPAPEPFRGQNIDRKNDSTTEESEESTIEVR